MQLTIPKKKGHKKKGEQAGDYAVSGVLYLEDTVNYVIDPEVTNTHDDERLWDYWREDPLLHVFHALYHRVYEHTYPRNANYQRFYYAHHQMKTRAAIERRLVGLPELGALILNVKASQPLFLSVHFNLNFSDNQKYFIVICHI